MVYSLAELKRQESQEETDDRDYAAQICDQW